MWFYHYSVSWKQSASFSFFWKIRRIGAVQNNNCVNTRWRRHRHRTGSSRAWFPLVIETMALAVCINRYLRNSPWRPENSGIVCYSRRGLPFHETFLFALDVTTARWWGCEDDHNTVCHAYIVTETCHGIKRAWSCNRSGNKFKSGFCCPCSHRWRSSQRIDEAIFSAVQLCVY